MIVFWRLALTYYIGAVMFYNRPFFAWRNRHPWLAGAVQSAAFFGIGAFLCQDYINHAWPLLGLWDLTGWISLAASAVFFAAANALFVYRSDQMKYHTVVFLIHDLAVLMFLFLCAPLMALYQTGNVVAAPWTIFAVGVLMVTKMTSVFVFMVEQDLYGRDVPTIDESFVTMLMRLIFFLIVLLPGWRWLVWFVVWMWACRMARRVRMLDFSRFALYFGAMSATAIGFLAKWAFYWK